MNNRIINKPEPDEYAPYFQQYIDLVPDGYVIDALDKQLSEAVTLYDRIEEQKMEYRYAPNKWSIKEIILHLLDTERIFDYRALRFSRKDKTPLPGFDQDKYITDNDWSNYPVKSIIKEYEIVRRYTIEFFNNLTEEMLYQWGVANLLNLSVRTIPYIIAGHERHHIDIIKSKYLIENGL